MARRPGLALPGTWGPFETGVRAILGQQISVAAANTLAARLVAKLGVRVDGLAALRLTHAFPPSGVLAAADLTGIGLTAARADAVQGFARAIAEQRLVLDRRARLDELVGAITSLRGLGPWTAQYLAGRMGEADAFPASDLGLRRAVADLTGGAPPTARELRARGRSWRPWRAYAAAHLWAHGTAI